MAVGLSRAELQQLYERRWNAYKNQAGGATDPQVVISASAVALLEVIEANNRKIESQLQVKGIRV